MKTKLNAFLALIAITSSAQAVTQYWSGSGIWNTDLLWSNTTTGPYTVAWNNTTADIAVFEGSAGTVSIGANINADRLDFNVTGYEITAAAPVTITGAGATNYNLAADVTATIGAGVTLQSSATSQNWNIKGGNKTTSILNLSGTIKNATGNSSSLLDATVNVNTGGQLIALQSIITGTGTTNSGSVLNISGGSVSIGNAGSSLILNNTGGITADSSVTLSSGSITFTDAANTNGVRFGPTGAVTNAATNLTGTFNLDGGTLTTNKVFMGSNSYTAPATYNATFNFNGGTLKALRSNTDFMTGLVGTGAIVKSGGAIIHTNGKDVTIGQALLHDASLDATPDGGLTKEGTGTLTLTGANTFTGATTINGGKLAITAPYNKITDTTINNSGRLKVNSNGTTPSTLTSLSLNSGSGLEFNLGTYTAANQPSLHVGTLQANDNYTIDLAGSAFPAGTQAITLLTYSSKSGSGTPIIGTLPSGALVLSGPTDTGSSIQLEIVVANQLSWSKGDGDWDSSSLNWNANAAAYAEPAMVTFPDLVEATNGVNDVNLTDTFNPVGITINNTGDFDTNAYQFSGSGAISGTTSITKTGAGMVKFSNANSYSGNLTISGGAVVKTIADDTTGNITVADTASFVLSSGVTDGSGQTITIAGPGPAANYFFTGSLTQRGSLQSQSGNNVWDGDIILTGTAGTGGNTRIGVQNGSTLTINGNISEGVTGMSPLFRAGDSLSDTITINGVGSWTGPTRLFSDGGALKLGGNDRFPTSAQLTVGSTTGPGAGTFFDLAGYNQTAMGLNGVPSGHIFNSGGPSILTLNPTGAVNFQGDIKGSISLVIGGTAIQSLSGDNTYTGDTTINTGGSLTIINTGELKFYPTTNGSTNSVGGSGTLAFDGTLRTDLSGADATVGNSWTLVDVTNLTETFGSTFVVADATLGNFTETTTGSGIWQLTDSGKTWTFTEADGQLTVAEPAAGYSAWQTANAPGQTVDQDHDSDGVANGIEYFMGESGTGFTTMPAIAGNSITWPMAATYTGTYGVDFAVQTSTDLVSWNPASIGTGADTVTVTAGTSVTYTLPAPSGKLFVRLLVNPN